MARTCMTSAALVVAIALCCAPTALAARGVDVASPVLPSTWKCLTQDYGVEWTAIRAWHSYGAPDANGPHTVYNAWDGGVRSVDVYLFPDSSKDAASQVQGMVSYLASYNITNNSPYGPPHTYGRVWLDIEGPGVYWGSDHSANANFIQELLSTAASLHLDVGIYTSASQWIPIVGSWTGGAAYPLWYANYDGAENFDDFSPFNGWTSPHIKQYSGSGSECGMTVDLDWFP